MYVCYKNDWTPNVYLEDIVDKSEERSQRKGRDEECDKPILAVQYKSLT